MPRKTLIFGNGLGMAFDPGFFDLDNAIGKVWHDDDLMDEAARTRVCRCLPRENNDRPHGEHELDTLQLALSASEFLANLETDHITWLSPEGQHFPASVRRFIYQTALQFHLHNDELPGDFVNSLANFVTETKSHIATLNYDNLLYQPLIERDILRGYDGALVDGFLDSGFAAKNLERKFGHQFGYYLHLHGSPLFVDSGVATLKRRQSSLVVDSDTVSSHIVLTHVDHKPAVIAASDVLLTYWEYLLSAMSESEEVVLFGYSGVDEHLNAILRNTPTSLSIRVVEWDGAGDEGDRWKFWTGVLNRKVRLEQYTSILEFRQW